jgi:hypothetical protein
VNLEKSCQDNFRPILAISVFFLHSAKHFFIVSDSLFDQQQ